VRVCHVSPHLPPDQAANALLPDQLGRWMRQAGHEIVYVAHEAAQQRSEALRREQRAQAGLAGPVRWIPRRAVLGRLTRALKVDSLRVARATSAALTAIGSTADLLHLHSNGLIVEVAAAWAGRRRLPYVLTLYGTEIWHYKRRQPIDPFTRAYERASLVTFYSQGLLDRARVEGLDRSNLVVIYPPVGEQFSLASEEARQTARAALRVREPLMILNVKRLHELAGQRFLIEAFARLARGRSDVRLVICGTGPLRASLEEQVQALGLSERVTLPGLVPHDVVARYMAAADVFALPSLLEALPTVAVEALATGTPVVSADHPGGVELHAIFNEDVAIVPREETEPLAAALAQSLDSPRRTHSATAQQIERRFRPAAVMREFEAVYRHALGKH
jgi:glycosyltransferase involved in cell wall biosynthesis